MISQPVEQFGCDEEILTSTAFTPIGVAGDIEQTIMHDPLVPWIHTLVDLVDHSEGSPGEGLEG